MITTEQYIAIIIQARVGSSRLPGKVLLPLAGKTVLERMVERVQRSREADAVIIATTEEKADDAIAELCKKMGVECFRGSTNDLLDRHYQAALRHCRLPDAVVKIPSDCPLIDPAIIDKVILEYRRLSPNIDFVSNLHPQTYPDGNDVEVMRFETLEKAWNEAKETFQREHTTPYIWDNPEIFRCANVEWETGLDFSLSHRWVLDYPEDYLFIRAVFEKLYPENPSFSITDVLDYCEKNIEITSLNQDFAGVNWYRHHLGELKHLDEKEKITKII